MHIVEVISNSRAMLFQGLRGAMAFALAYRNTATDNRQVMATTTSMVVILTVFLNGGLTSWMIDRLQIKYVSIQSFDFRGSLCYKIVAVVCVVVSE